MHGRSNAAAFIGGIMGIAKMKIHARRVRKKRVARRRLFVA
jgi:hypothetical protein